MNVFRDISSYLPPQVHDHLNVRLIAMDDVDLNERWEASGVRSPFWRLYLNDRKGAVVAVGRKHYPLLKGEPLLIPAWVQFDCWNTMRLRHFFIHFDLAGFSPLVVRKVWNKPVLLGAVDGIAATARRIGRGIRANRRDSAQLVSEAKSLVYGVLARAIPEGAMDGRWEFGGVSLIEPAMRHIESQIPRAVSNVTLAAMCHRSRSHFIRMFQQAVGMTPKQYVLERRIAWAAERLAQSTESIEAIAGVCGFQNRFYFTRAFARVMGLPPARYRKMTL
jgi:AraC-like DNA-binding protein